MTKEKKRLSFAIYAAVLLLVVAAGRVTMTVYNNVSVDIAYAPWFADLFRYATDILNGAKIALGYGAIAYLTHYASKKTGTVTLLLYLGVLLAENAARFLIDWFSSSVTYYGISLTLIALGTRFLLEGVFALAAWLIARFFLRQREKSGSKTRLFTMEKGAAASILLYMTSPLFNEIVYLLEHFSLYGEMTAEELSVCIGSFLYILIMYGCIPLLCCQGVFLLVKRLFPQNLENKGPESL